jgi:hypothetical protein
MATEDIEIGVVDITTVCITFLPVSPLPKLTNSLQISRRDDVQDHKDGLNRYTKIDAQNANKDHYLCPDDGKLCLLDVQRAPGYERPAHPEISWSDPPEKNIFKSGWQWFQSVPKQTLTWTYNDWVKHKYKCVESK